MRFIFFLLTAIPTFACAQAPEPISYILGALEKLNSPRRACNPTIPSRPLRPKKDFLVWNAAPAWLRASSSSVRSICFCENSGDTCATVTSLGKGSFFTNEHVIESLLKDKKAYESFKQKKCDWIVALPGGKSQKINPKVVKRGWWNHGDSKYVDLDHTKDLAFLEIPELSNTPTVKLASGSPKIGEPVYVAGFPMTARNVIFDRSPMKPALSSGVVTSINSLNNSADFVGVGGMSGGPVFNRQGEMVGVFWGKEHTDRDEALFSEGGLPAVMPRETSYFIPVDQFRKAVPSVGVIQSLKKMIGY